ncbi:MAG TPA: mechanosensitive ion channel domain-containing protein [Pirellulales bacterium]|nr:mechanosensitive ion channel domain-containing protein [Pirellulales bacterium]
MNSLWERFLDKFSPNEANLKEFADNCWHLLANLVLAALVLIAFWIAGAMLRRFVLRIGGRARMNADVLVLLASTAKLVLLAIGLVTASGNLGIDVSALVAGLGLTGFAVGFAVKDIISNWLAGILILLYEPFRRGDYVSIANTPGLEGAVVAIDFRYTSLQNKDQLVLVPNSNLFVKEILVKRAAG